jgi:lipopolysaccharide/colanic/teichoic acid biosynthesis glycosyltransferase
MSDISIREATLDDLPTLLRFEQGVIEAESPMDAGLKPGKINYYDIEQFIRSPDIRLAVAEIDGKLVGCGYARIGLNRFLLRRCVYYSRQYGFFLTPTLIIGMNQEGFSLAQQLVGWYTSGLNVLGFINNGTGLNQSLARHLPQLGDLSDLDYLVRKHNIQELIVVTSAVSRDEITSIFERYGRQDDINVRLSSGLFEIITTGLEVKEIANVPLVTVNHLRLKSSERIAKLILDYSIVILAGLLTLPVVGFIALLVKLDSPGPIIHRRRVMGINGKQFFAYKFRTMHENGDEILAQHPELLKKLQEDHKLKNDPRVTRVGHYLRKFSLDELPQLLNILKREIAVVGPRIIAP